MSNTQKIRVALVDDHTLIRDALALAIQQFPDMQVVASYATGEEIVNNVRHVRPDVILMDILLKGMSGIEATRWIKERDRGIKIILLSGEVKKEFVTAGIQSGIDGYLSKDAERQDLIEAIRRVHKGEKHFNEAITALVFEDFYKKEVVVGRSLQERKTYDLSKREMEVLALVANGKTNKEVADQLSISVKTVDSHKLHILEKLGLRNTAELVKYAIKNNLIVLE